MKSPVKIIAPMVLLLLTGTGCYESDTAPVVLEESIVQDSKDYFSQKADCGSRLVDAQKYIESKTMSHGGSTLDKICFSPRLNTCVLEYTYFWNNDRSASDVNWVDRRYVDLLTTEVVTVVRGENVVDFYSEVIQKQVSDAQDEIGCAP